MRPARKTLDGFPGLDLSEFLNVAVAAGHARGPREKRELVRPPGDKTDARRPPSADRRRAAASGPARAVPPSNAFPAGSVRAGRGRGDAAERADGRSRGRGDAAAPTSWIVRDHAASGVDRDLGPRRCP